uniref:non-specific serine/threonine protein kinase n=1 Tax=Setaria viridis TaxID=4556 RepID=A0A4U6VWV4_SETVI|nr:hypothetical protein SEVIR_2G171366v2 [Setaria viridis]
MHFLHLLVVLGLHYFSTHTTSSSAATYTLPHGHALTSNKMLVSGNGKFALGFFQTGSKSSNNTSTLTWAYGSTRSPN